MQETFSIQLSSMQTASVERLLSSLGHASLPTKTPYELWRTNGGGVNAIMYSSGKLVIQGVGASELNSEIEKVINSDVDSAGLNAESGGVGGFTARVGADEVGKGDYFGPMVVAAAYVKPDDIAVLKRLGVGDSKKISDAKILEMFAELSSVVKYRAQVLTPEQYNDLYPAVGNVAILLSKLHAKNIELLLEQLGEEKEECGLVVIDQFSKNKGRLLSELGPLTKECEFRQFHKGESDPAVAAASIIARALFLNAWEVMNSEWEFKFPKGATTVIDAGKMFVKQHGEENLKRVAKISFKTTAQVLG